MITDVKKYLLFGLQSEIHQFFERVQQQGFIEFISNKRQKKVETEEVYNLINALKILKKEPRRSPSKEKIHPETVAKTIIETKCSLDSIEEEKRFLQKEIEKISPLGNFSIEDLTFIQENSDYSLSFYCRKTQKAKAEQNPLPESLIYVSTEYDLDYFVSISKEELNDPSFLKIDVQDSLPSLKQKLEEVRDKELVLLERLSAQTKYIISLEKALKHHINHESLSDAKDGVSTPTNQSLFMVEAWIPASHIEQLDRILEHHDISYEEVKIEDRDRVPTYFENKGFSRIGEDLVCVYDVPDVKDKDPSSWVLFSFALFFAIIIGDAGYGLVYLTLFLLMKFGLKNKNTMLLRLTKLTGLLSFTCITWGILTASFFGLNISPNSPYRKFSAIQYLANKKADYHLKVKDDVYDEWVKKYPEIEDTIDTTTFFKKTMRIKDGSEDFEALGVFYDNILLEISLLIGVIHLMFAFLRYLRVSPAGIGWIVFMIGGYLYFPHSVSATSMLHYLNIISKQTAFMIGPYIIFSGIGLALILAVIQQGISGIAEIINVIQVFADVLSYLRLYALGLAGMIMASTFNMLAAKTPIVFAIPILIAGHFVNILLSLMSGVIHGLRLNFLEWYRWCFEGEGKKFNPLRKI